MDNVKLMKWVGTVVFMSLAVFNIIDLAFTMKHYEFGADVAGPYSIFSSQKVFIAYHVWGIAMAVLSTYTMWKEIRLLFMISLLIMLLLMFYPYFTGSPLDKKAGVEQVEKEKARQDSIRKSDSLVEPVPLNDPLK